MAATTEGGLDVDWLLQSKREHSQATAAGSNLGRGGHPPYHTQQSDYIEPVSESLHRRTDSTLTTDSHGDPQKTNQGQRTNATSYKNGDASQTAQKASGSPSPQLPKDKQQVVRSLPTKGSTTEDSKKGARPSLGNTKKEGRRSSWISSISSKFSSNSPAPSRNFGLDFHNQTNVSASPQSSPKFESGNPLNKKELANDAQREINKDENKPPPAVYTPKRQSVLVPAGKETKIDQPGFLSSALRRLSSSTATSMGKVPTQGAICPRRVMNIDNNRERIQITEFDQNKLKRVAFCVDVEIAGVASQADEDSEHHTRPPVSAAQKQSINAPEKLTSTNKDSKDAKFKDKGEGAALKNPASATEQKETTGQTRADADAEAEAEEIQSETQQNTAEASQASDPQSTSTTRKKEKKKRSEAERKERKERKRKHAEANGMVPLELTREGEDTDSSQGHTPPGSSTPHGPTDGRTIDPLRIYKRCCQLRETTVLSRVKEQISKPSATLAEAPGTVAFVDLSELRLQLHDIVTLGDWLAVVPVRKLSLSNCGLTDEGLRMILSGLASCKSAEQARQNRKLPKRHSGKRGTEQMGVIEKLSLKDNTGITNVGWRHIALFIHMTRSLKAIDLSGIPFPKAAHSSGNTTITNTTGNGVKQEIARSSDLASLICLALSERLGDKLEELILSGCGLSTSHVRDIVDCAIKCKIKRLGLADNNLDAEAMQHVVRYIKSGACEGLDLGSNNLDGAGKVIANAFDENSPLFAISFSDCDLTSSDLTAILTPFSKLKNLKFIDFSRNKKLFAGQSNAVSALRRLLPKLPFLRRIHLTDVEMTPDQAIALSEILPDCPELAHVCILENAPLISAMNSKDGGAQEEACAFFASLMTAVRVSKSIVAIEIEVPNADSSEVVRALASQVIAYGLRNLERNELDDVGVKPINMPTKEAPEVLLHLVGHMEGYSINEDDADPAPDEDYMIASTGIVKALGVCLGSNDATSRGQSRNISPAPSGTVTPRYGGNRQGSLSKPRDVSLELCESARKIRMRLRPAMLKEDRAGNDYNYRRFLLLDQTLERMIQRFEDEYPETKLATLEVVNDLGAPNQAMADASLLSASVDSNPLSTVMSADDEFMPDGETAEHSAVRMHRSPSSTSLVSKAFTDEEGRMHRFGQNLRREVLKPTPADDNLHGAGGDDAAEPTHFVSLHARLDELRGEEIRQRVEKDGVDIVIRQLGINAHDLMSLKEQDPEGFEAFRSSQLAAQINGGMIDRDSNALEE